LSWQGNKRIHRHHQVFFGHVFPPPRESGFFLDKQPLRVTCWTRGTPRGTWRTGFFLRSVTPPVGGGGYSRPLLGGSRPDPPPLGLKMKPVGGPHRRDGRPGHHSDGGHECGGGSRGPDSRIRAHLMFDLSGTAFVLDSLFISIHLSIYLLYFLSIYLFFSKQLDTFFPTVDAIVVYHSTIGL